MKKVLKILGIILSIFIIVVIIIALWVNFSPAPSYEIQSTQLNATPDAAALQRGANIVSHLCAVCHLGADNRLSGRLIADSNDPFGELWSGNITKHPTSGIGSYTDQELAYLFRTGIKKDGYFAGPYMTKVQLSDEDIVAIIEFLKSDDPLVSASEKQHPEPKFSFLKKALEKFGLFAPEKYSPLKITTPSADETIKFGRYLATEVYECYNCHSASFASNKISDPEQSVGYFGGGNLLVDPSLGSLPAPNLTMHVENGIGSYNESEFGRMVRKGIRPDQSKMTALMPEFSNLSDKEIHAIWEYLKTVPILEGN